MVTAPAKRLIFKWDNSCCVSLAQVRWRALGRRAAAPCAEDVVDVPGLSFHEGKFLGRKASGGYFTGLRLPSFGVSGPAEPRARAPAEQRYVGAGVVPLPECVGPLHCWLLELPGKRPA